MEAKEVFVLSDQHAPNGECELEMGSIGSTDQSCICRRRYVDAAPPQACCDVTGDVLVEVKPDGHRSGSFFQAFLTKFLLEQRCVSATELVCECSRVTHFLLNLFHVVEIVSEGGVDIRKGDGRDVRDDLVGRHPLMFVPDHDIAHAHPVASNTSFTTANAGRPRDSLASERGHNSSIAARCF